MDVWDKILDEMVPFCQDNFPYMLVDIELWGGRISEITTDATAFAYRQQLFNVVFVIVVPADMEHAHRTFHHITLSADDVWGKISKHLQGA